ncbi:MAG: flagellar hook-associated protein FlgK [Spirochaetales bacterium]|nr:flagellar hook-associated protein FlgK [Spirochaetales bacterium]
MQSTFAGIEIGKRSLVAHTQGLSTVGHNISNASNPGYSRQRVQLTPMSPLYMPGLSREETPGQVGQGVVVQRIERVRDQILEKRIVAQANGTGYWEAMDRYLLMVEQVYNEPTELSTRTLMDRFWDSWQELSLHPEETASRLAVLERGEALVEGFHHEFASLKEIRDMLEEEIQVTVTRVNALLKEVAEVNEQIVKIEAMGDNPNDLLDRRDLLVQELSGIINITVDGRDPDEFTIHTGGLHLLQGRNVHPLGAEPSPLNEGYSRVTWQDSGETAYFAGGKLAALVELRDIDLKNEIQNLDMMVVNFMDLVNEIHTSAYGANGKTGLEFFTEYPFVENITGNYDRNGDGEFDSTWLFRVNGTNTLHPEEQIGLAGVITLAAPGGTLEVEYFPTDTVADLVHRINVSGAEVSARLSREGTLSLRATPAAQEGNPDFVLRYLEDSGQFLTGYAGILINPGPEGAYRWDTADAAVSLRGGGLEYAVAPLSHPAGWIEINPAVKADPLSVAAGFGINGRPAEEGDGSAALAVAALRNNDVMAGGITSFDNYFSETVANAGLKGETAQRAYETQNAIMQELKSMRDSISGVNVDEEFAQLIKYQHGYAAAARFITTFNTLLDTIINRMGV